MVRMVEAKLWVTKNVADYNGDRIRELEGMLNNQQEEFNDKMKVGNIKAIKTKLKGTFFMSLFFQLSINSGHFFKFRHEIANL